VAALQLTLMYFKIKTIMRLLGAANGRVLDVVGWGEGLKKRGQNCAAVLSPFL